MDLQREPELRAEDPAESTPTVRVLGPLVVEQGGRAIRVAGTHRRRLLALLASRPGRGVSVDTIVDALWGEDPPPSAAKTLQSHVARLRASLAELGQDVVETTSAGYGLSAAVTVDAAAFAERVADGHRRLTAGDLAGAIGVLEGALATWRGTPYADFPEAEFAEHERTRLFELHAAATEDLAEARLESGAAERVVPELEHLVAEHPGRERAWSLLMRALYANGRQQDALVAFQRARRTLLEEFGLDPGPELRALERRILDQDATLTITRRATVPLSLRTGADPLRGREAETAWLTEAWAASTRGSGQLCLLLGPPGSGRTRLAAQLAGVATADHGTVRYARAADGLASLSDGSTAPATPAGLVAAVIDESRRHPVLIVIDDAEWSNSSTADAIAALTSVLSTSPVTLVVIADPAGGGPAVEAIARLDPTRGRTLTLAPLADDDIARLVADEGIDDPGAVAAIVSVAAGRPGVAREEAATWAEQLAGDRLHRAASSSARALAAADDSRSSVVEEVALLVRARARRHQLASAAWVGRQPYRRLAAYGPADADVFVGRERLVAELAARVLDRRVVVVTGASGSGKSSIVRAGLVPLAQSGRLPGQVPWRIAVVVPGEDPLRALDAVADLDEPGPQLLVVDQFEEAFAAGGAAVDGLVGRLLDLALDPALDAHVVLVVRADRFADLAEAWHPHELIGDGPLLVGRPSADELRRIVEEPARRAGTAVEPGLVADVLADVGDAEGALPLVSTALAELWDGRDGDTLTAARYQELGGLTASVERLGDGVLSRVASPDDVRLMLLRLADVTDDGEWIRRRIPAAGVPAALEPALAELVEGRLVVRTDETVEIVHEVVFRAWPRLVAWLDAARADLVLGRDVRVAARGWDEGGRDDDDVYRGARLALATEWSERHADLVAPVVAAFLAAGRVEADRARLEAEAQLARERRASRRLRRALVAASVLLVLALSATALALVSRQRADEERDRAAASAASADVAADEADVAAAEANRAADVAADREAEARAARDAETEARDAAEAERDAALVAKLVAESGQAIGQQLDLALLLAVEAHRRTDSVATKGALLTALTQVRPDPDVTAPLGDPIASSLRGLFPTGLDRTFGVDVSDDGETVVLTGTAAGSPTVVFVDLATQTERWRLPDVDYTSEPDLAADGSIVLVAAPRTIAVHDRAGARRVIADLPSDGPEVIAASLSPDGTAIGVVMSDGAIRFLDTANGASTGAAPPGGAVAGRFAPDGTFAYGSFAGPDQDTGLTIHRWDHRVGVERSQVVLDPSPGGGYPPDLVFSPDLALLVGVGARNEDGVDVWDATNGRVVGDSYARPRLARGNPAFVTKRVIAIGRTDGRLAFYDLAADRMVRGPIETSGSGIWDLAATPDGRLLFSVGDDGSLRRWGTDDEGPLETPVVPWATLADVSTDLSHFVVRAPDDTLVVHRSDGRGRPVWIPPPEGFDRYLQWPTLSGDGSRVAGWIDGPIPQAYVADARSGEVLWIGPPDRPYFGVEISVDGRSIVAHDVDAGALIRVDVDSGEIVATLQEAGLTDASQAMHPSRTSDGRYVDLNLFDRVVRLDAATLAVVHDVPVDFGLQGGLAAVPGTDVVIGGGLGGRLVRVDLASGEIQIGRSNEATSLTEVALSPDGSLIAAQHPFASSIALFDAATLQPIGEPIPAALASGPVPHWFTTDGDLVGVSRFGLSRWELDPAAWELVACRTAGRNLTRAEWSEHLGDEPYRPTCDLWPTPTS